MSSSTSPVVSATKLCFQAATSTYSTTNLPLQPTQLHTCWIEKDKGPDGHRCRKSLLPLHKQKENILKELQGAEHLFNLLLGLIQPGGRAPHVSCISKSVPNVSSAFLTSCWMNVPETLQRRTFTLPGQCLHWPVSEAHSENFIWKNDWMMWNVWNLVKWMIAKHLLQSHYQIQTFAVVYIFLIKVKMLNIAVCVAVSC